MPSDSQTNVSAHAGGSARRTLAACGGAHALHDGFTDLLNVLYPLLQAQFGLSYATIGALKRLHPSLGDGDVEVSVELAERYRKARADKKAAEERIDQCEAEIRAALAGDHNRAVRGGKLVASRSVYERKAYEVAATTIDKLNPGRAESYA